MHKTIQMGKLPEEEKEHWQRRAINLNWAWKTLSTPEQVLGQPQELGTSKFWAARAPAILIHLPSSGGIGKSVPKGASQALKI